jgi:D-xylose 1-dehydrogenase (NADP+, D-xylono-1,5-lactone-forming)
MSVSAVRWGFIGAGNIAQRALSPAVYAADGAVLYAVASRDPARSALLRPQTVHTGYPELLADPAVDAVYINLHNEAHKRWVVAALEAGKHVLCEKPLGLNAAEVAEMTEAARAADRLLVEAMWSRWHPRTREAEQLIADGALGAVRHVTSAWENPAAPAADNYRHVPALGGGALLDVGCYAVAAALWAYQWQVPEAITAELDRWEGGADRRATATLHFRGGGTADIAASFTGDGREVLTADGTAGALELVPPAFSAGRGQTATMRLRTGEGESAPSWPPVDPFQLMVEEFSRAVRGEPAMLIPLEQSYAVASVLDRIFAAASPAG